MEYGAFLNYAPGKTEGLKTTVKGICPFDFCEEGIHDKKSFAKGIIQ